MSSEFSVELRYRGNEAFTAKRYEDAIVLYDRAIEADPHSIANFNNRAAANHELKKFDAAIEDAKKALVIQDNPRSHYRIGAALWAQMKLPEAKAAFEKVIVLDATNKNAQDSVRLIDRAMSNIVRGASTAAARASGASMTADGIVIPPLQGGEFTVVPTGLLGAAMDVLVLGTLVCYVICTFFQPALARTVWNLLMSVTMAQQLVVMKAKGILRLNSETMNLWLKNLSSLMMLLCFLALLIGVTPQLLIGGMIGLYSVLDLASHRNEIGTVLGPLGSIATPYLMRVSDKHENYVLMAASCEAVFSFAIPLTGGTWFTLVYIQYIINRYKTDRYVQASFSGLRKNVMTTTERFLPAACARYVNMFCDVLHRVSQQSM